MTLTIMSFNIRGSFHDEADGVNSWHGRRDLNIATIKKYDPDIIGFQEVQTRNLVDYENHLKDYTIEQGFISVREGETRHYVPIYYRASRFEKVASGGFYLSATPDKWSIDADAVFARAATWIILTDTSVNQNFLVLNTHYPHKQESDSARTRASKLIAERLKLHTQYIPCFLTGDFNALPDSNAYHIYRDNGFEDTFLLAGHEGNPNTFHGFQGEGIPYTGLRIDWILLHNTGNRLRVNSFEVITDHEHPIYPSDHYPVMTQLEWTSDA